MATLAERRRNNVRAGVFVTIAILLGVVVMVVLTDALEKFSRRTERYTVTFDVASGVNNLKPGSEVRVGGVRMGEVLAVEPHVQEGQAFREIHVAFAVDRRVTIFEGATVLVTTRIIGADAWLDIPNVGDPSRGRPAGNRLQGTPSMGLLTTLLGAENADMADEMVANARDFTGFLARVPQEYETRIVPTIDDIKASAVYVRETTQDMHVVMDELRTMRWPTWAQAVDRVMTWAAAATERIDGAIAEGKGLFADSRAVIAENRESIRNIAENVQQATERINSQTLEKLHALLNTGQEGLDQAVAAMTELRTDYAGWSTNIGEALANANMASQQLKLTMIETRRSPWKVLYRPSADELEHELLYEAARSFAVAAADLKAASEAIRRVLDTHGERLAENHDAYQRVERNLLNSLANYEKAQQQLMDVIVADGKPK